MKESKIKAISDFSSALESLGDIAHELEKIAGSGCEEEVTDPLKRSILSLLSAQASVLGYLAAWIAQGHRIDWRSGLQASPERSSTSQHGPRNDFRPSKARAG
jgi:hypothetical protein